jgi:phospholipid/cholesterol/gamma-HCH transport system permease protein
VKAPVQLDQQSGRELMERVSSDSVSAGQVFVLDLQETTSIDSLGAAWLVEIADFVRSRHAEFQYENQAGDVAEFLQMVEPSLRARPRREKSQSNMLARFGDAALRFGHEFREFLALMIDAIYWTLLAPFEGRGFRWSLFVDEIHEMGVRAIRIVVLMNFLLGVIIAMLSSKQAEAYGITIYVADAIVIGFARELAAIMTAVVISARTGAAIAAEISTMKVQEEIDALRGLGISVTQWLVAPKVLALTLVLPCLTALGFVAGVFGGGLWGVYVLGFQPAVWYNQTLAAADVSDLTQGFLKSLVFAVAIALIGCHNGLRVTGGSRGVGLMTTRAVVMDIFMLIVIDIAFATVFYYMAF